MEKPKVGEFVQHFANQEAKATPAIVVDHAENGNLQLNVFTVDTSTSNPVKQALNVPHASKAVEDQPYWEYFDEE